MQNEEFKTIHSNLPSASSSILGVFEPNQREELPLVLSSMVEDYPFGNLSDLNQLEIPTIVIGNEDDPLHPLEISKIISESIQGSSLKTVTSRYINNNDHQHQVIKYISQFISDNEKSLER